MKARCEGMVEMLRGGGYVGSDLLNSDGETPILYPTVSMRVWEGILKLLRACENLGLDRPDEDSRHLCHFYRGGGTEGSEVISLVEGC